jgi:choline dehydrogenase
MICHTCDQKGVPKVDCFNRGDNEGCAYFDVNQRSGVRLNSSKAFLHPVLRSRPNLTLITRAHVTRVVLEKGRAVGVEYFHGDDPANLRLARASSETILCAGAVGSPHILQLSGLGPADLLRRHGIPVELDLPGVGRNLQDHLQARFRPARLSFS